MLVIVGASFTARTVTTKPWLALNCPSLTPTVIVATPLWLAAGITVTVRLAPLPPNTMLLVGTSAGLEEPLLKVRPPALLSPSPSVKFSASVAVSSSIVWSAMPVIVGGVFNPFTYSVSDWFAVIDDYGH